MKITAKCTKQRERVSKQQVVSHFEIFDGLRQVWKLYVLYLLRDVHVLDGGDGSSRGSTETGLESLLLVERKFR